MSKMFRNLCMCIPKRSAMQSPCPRCSKMHRIPTVLPLMTRENQTIGYESLELPLGSKEIRMVLDPTPASILITRDDVDISLKTGNKDPRGKAPGVDYWYSYKDQQWRKFRCTCIPKLSTLQSPCPICSKSYAW